jgi:ribosomal protein S18 acetylase RimI-like enzyme
MADGLTIRVANDGDAETVIALLDSAAAWLTARGIRQWGVGDFGAETRAALARGEVYLAHVGGQVAGTFRVHESDAHIWGSDDGLALYVHRLATSRAFAGRELGVALLDEAARLARAAGKPYLRLDCHADNAALCDYYARRGFTLVRRVPLGAWPCALFEKPVGEKKSEVRSQ